MRVTVMTLAFLAYVLTIYGSRQLVGASNTERHFELSE